MSRISTVMTQFTWIYTLKLCRVRSIWLAPLQIFTAKFAARERDLKMIGLAILAHCQNELRLVSLQCKIEGAMFHWIAILVTHENLHKLASVNI